MLPDCLVCDCLLTQVNNFRLLGKFMIQNY